jgi:hypothetical protein
MLTRGSHVTKKTGVYDVVLRGYTDDLIADGEVGNGVSLLLQSSNVNRVNEGEQFFFE